MNGGAKGLGKTLRFALAFELCAACSACGDDAGVSAEPSVREDAPPVQAASQPVVNRSGPGGSPFSVTLRSPGEPSAWHRPIGARTFEVALRPATLAQYPCTSCHVGPNVARDRAADAHQDVQAVHPSEARGACSACHAPSDVARLVLQGGETATIDEAYRLCGQCHAPVAEAWAGGAHGKRLVGWQGPRVVMGCADCHDPHAPTTPRKIPFRGPILP